MLRVLLGRADQAFVCLLSEQRAITNAFTDTDTLSVGATEGKRLLVILPASIDELILAVSGLPVSLWKFNSELLRGMYAMIAQQSSPEATIVPAVASEAIISPVSLSAVITEE